MMNSDQIADIENRMGADMTKTLRSYGITSARVGTDMFQLLLDELVMDGMHQVERFTDWPEDVTYD